MPKKAAKPEAKSETPKPAVAPQTAPRVKPAIRNAQRTAALEAEVKEPTPVDKIAASMELPDSNFDPEVDLPFDEVEAKPEAETPARERDPDTGRFVKQEHNPYFVDLAKEAGISEQTISTLTPEQLEKAIAFRSTLRKDAEVSKAQTKEPALDQLEAQLDLDSLLPADQYDPNVRDAFKKLEAKYEKRLAQIENHLRGQVVKESDNQIHRAFDALGDDRLGKGEVDKDSPEMRRRAAVFNEARRLAGEKADLKAVLAKLDEGRKLLYGDKAPAKETTTPTNGHSRISPEEWAGATTLKPTSRSHPPEPKGEARAVRNVHQKLRELHMGGVTLEGKEEATVP